MPLSALPVVSNPRFLVLMLCCGFNLGLLAAMFSALSENTIARRHQEPTRALVDFRRNAKKAMLSARALISTHEPCPMCTGAIIWAKVSEIVYGCSIKDTIKLGWTRAFLISS
jgi:tRNA(Arg) A34 adenosine deaminase TadA